MVSSMKVGKKRPLKVRVRRTNPLKMFGILPRKRLKLQTPKLMHESYGGLGIKGIVRKANVMLRDLQGGNSKHGAADRDALADYLADHDEIDLDGVDSNKLESILMKNSGVSSGPKVSLRINNPLGMSKTFTVGRDELAKLLEDSDDFDIEEK